MDIVRLLTDQELEISLLVFQSGGGAVSKMETNK